MLNFFYNPLKCWESLSFYFRSMHILGACPIFSNEYKRSERKSCGGYVVSREPVIVPNVSMFKILLFNSVNLEEIAPHEQDVETAD